MKKILISTAIAAALAAPGLVGAAGNHPPPAAASAVTSGVLVSVGGHVSVGGNGMDGIAHQTSTAEASNTSTAEGSGYINDQPFINRSGLGYTVNGAGSALTRSSGSSNSTSTGLVAGSGTGFTVGLAIQHGSGSSEYIGSKTYGLNRIKVTSDSEVVSLSATGVFGTGHAAQRTDVSTNSLASGSGSSSSNYGWSGDSLETSTLSGTTYGDSYSESSGTKTGGGHGVTFGHAESDSLVTGRFRTIKTEIGGIPIIKSDALAKQNSYASTGNFGVGGATVRSNGEASINANVSRTRSGYSVSTTTVATATPDAGVTFTPAYGNGVAHGGADANSYIFGKAGSDYIFPN